MDVNSPIYIGDTKFNSWPVLTGYDTPFCQLITSTPHVGRQNYLNDLAAIKTGVDTIRTGWSLTTVISENRWGTSTANRVIKELKWSKIYVIKYSPKVTIPKKVYHGLNRGKLRFLLEKIQSDKVGSQYSHYFFVKYEPYRKESHVVACLERWKVVEEETLLTRCFHYRKPIKDCRRANLHDFVHILLHTAQEIFYCCSLFQRQ